MSSVSMTSSLPAQTNVHTRAPNAARALADHVPTRVWAFLAFAFTVLSLNRWGIAALSWVAPVPWLVLALRVQSQKGWGAFFGLALVTQVTAMAKAVSEPISPIIAPMFGIPQAFGTLLLAFVWRAARLRGGPRAAVLVYVGFALLAELFVVRTSDLGAWSSSANPLVTDLTLLQLCSLFGLGGIALLLALTSALVATLLTVPSPRLFVRDIVVAALLVVAAYGYGAYRLDAGTNEARSVRVAAVTTSLGMGKEGLPSDAALRKNTDELFLRSEAAMRLGAELVVWNEAAAFMRPEDESAFVARARALAARYQKELVLAYGVLVQEEPFRFRNEYLWLDGQGQTVELYAKHHPVPGEPSVRGEDPLRAHDHAWGRAAGAICYDYDFPEMALAHGKLGADLVVVPASDWRAIDPYHGEMARVRAIEGGFSVLRPVRWATSFGFDALGRVRGAMAASDPQHMLIMTLPTQRVDTLYVLWGDWPVVLLGSALLSAGLYIMVTRRRAA